MTSFAISIVLGVIIGAATVFTGATPGNYAYGKIVPLVFIVSFVVSVCLTWFPLALFGLFLKRRRDRHSPQAIWRDPLLLVSAIPFCLGLFVVGSGLFENYSNRNELLRIDRGQLNAKEQMRIVTRYQDDFKRGGGQSSHWEALFRLVRSPLADPEVLRFVASDQRLDYFRQNLAANPNTPMDILIEYSKDRNLWMYLGNNPKWTNLLKEADKPRTRTRQ